MQRFAIASVIVALGLAAVLTVSNFTQSDTVTTAQAEPEPAPAATTQDLRPGQLADPGEPRFNTRGWATDFSISSVPFDQIFSGGPPKDGIPAIDNPIFESIDAARAPFKEFPPIDGFAPVIAVELNGEAKAYPMAIMIWHEITNDIIGGEPVVVTFCPLCNTALVFKATVDGEVKDFGTTGNLLASNLVMYDRQSETWWQQATGLGIVGEEMGTQLEFIPAQIISLDEFEATYPDGQVLSRDTGFRRSYGRNPYLGYDRADESPFLFAGTTDGRIAPKERVATAGSGDQAIAFAYPQLSEVGVANATVDDEPIVVFWMPGTRSSLGDSDINQAEDVGTTGVYSPVVDGRELTFVRDGDIGTPITDVETGSTWSITGVATDGELTGTQLERIQSADHLWFSWAAFNPDTRIWDPALDGEDDGLG